MPQKSSDGASLKERVRSGETVLGLHVPIGLERDRVRYILDREPYEFLWVDSQHAPLNEETLVSFCAMASDLGLPVQLRIKHTLQAYMIGNYLDLGPSGVEVPSGRGRVDCRRSYQQLLLPPGRDAERGRRHSGREQRAKRPDRVREMVDRLRGPLDTDRVAGGGHERTAARQAGS